MSGTNAKPTYSKDIVFLSGKRTPFGTFGGALKGQSATDLAVHASQAALEQAQVAGDDVDHVVFGNVCQTSADAIYLARHVGLRSGLPQAVPAVTVNRLCGSGFQSLVDAANLIELGQAEVVLAGGTESMSQAPHIVRGARWGLALGKSDLEDSLWSALTDTYTGMPMAITAENLAERHDISRQECDIYAALSQARHAKAQSEGYLAQEIAAVELKSRKGARLFEADEHGRADTTEETLGGLRPVFKKDGVVTAGNASGICDGAAATVMSTMEYAQRNDLKPLGRIIAYGVSGCDPEVMGIGPVPAARIAMDRAGMKMMDFDLVEVNEAFAPQYLAVERELKLDREITNVNGGAIALGHPLGASGTRITTTLLYELQRRGGRFGLGSACIGGGQGIAVIVEAL